MARVRMPEQFFNLTEVSRLLNFDYRRLKKLSRMIQPAAFNGDVRLYRLDQFSHLVGAEERTHMVRKFRNI
jgi:hypothetical protein